MGKQSQAPREHDINGPGLRQYASSEVSVQYQKGLNKVTQAEKHRVGAPHRDCNECSS